MAEVTYYFNTRDTGVEQWSYPASMVDGILTNYAYTSSDGRTQTLNGNSYLGIDLGTINKVELRAYGYGDGNDRIDLTPFFSAGNGNKHQTTPGATADWTAYIDITNDPNAPTSWGNLDIANLDCLVEYDKVGKGNTMYCSKVEIRVTYWEPPESDIDVGAGPLDRASSLEFDYTFVAKDNPANASGTLHSVKVYAQGNISDLVVGTFYTTNGNTLKCRDSEAIGAVEAGAERTFTELSITVETGDYIGCYFSTAGSIEIDLSGFSGIWYQYGEYIDPNDETDYIPYAGCAMSLYGYGDFAVGGFIQIQYTAEPPTPSAWNQLKDAGGTGWVQVNYEGE